MREQHKYDFTIVVIDDDADVLLMNAEVLKRAGYKVMEAITGQDGLELTRTYYPDLIILDVLLPDFAGTEVCKKIKEDPTLKDIMVTLASGVHVFSASQGGGLDCGADYLYYISNAEFKSGGY